MSEQTYTVAEIVGDPTFWDGGGDSKKATNFWAFKAEGDDRLYEIGRKPDNPLKVGDSFVAEVKGESYGKTKLKRVQGGGGYSGGGKKDEAYRADPAKLRGEAMRSAIHAASNYVTAMAAVDRIPPSFWESFENYKTLDPMIRHWYGLIVEAQAEPGERAVSGGQT